MARMVQLGPPAENASLNRPVTVLVSPSLHDGRVTQESRGMLTASARDRSADTCSRIVVSLWPLPDAVVPGSPKSLPCPVRVSVPMTRTLSASYSVGSVGAALVGRFVPAWISCLLMLSAMLLRPAQATVLPRVATTVTAERTATAIRAVRWPCVPAMRDVCAGRGVAAGAPSSGVLTR